jgi:ATP-dependent DNA helicase DinG
MDSLMSISCDQFFGKILPSKGLEKRDSQLELSKAIYTAMTTNKILLSEAAVGTGKTFAYLYPSILYLLNTGKKVLIVTKTIALQQQLVKRDIPKLIEILYPYNQRVGKINYSAMKGKNNYLCEKRLMNTIENSSSKINKEIYQNILCFYDSEHIYDKREYPFFISSQDWDRICVQQCSKSTCEILSCEYRKQKFQQITDITVTNYNYLMSCFKDDYNYFLDKFGVLIFDEAHSLEGVAYDVFGSHLSLKEGQDILQNILDKTKINYSKIINDVDIIMRKLFKKVRQNTFFKDEFIQTEFDVNLYDDVIENMVEEICEKIDIISDKFNVMVSMKNEDRKSSNDKAIDRDITALSQYYDRLRNYEDYIWWVQKDKDNKIELYNAPKNISEILQGKIFEAYKPTILVSGTISARMSLTTDRNDFSCYEQTIGIRDNPRLMEPIVIPSDFDYKNHAAIYFEKEISFVPLDDIDKRYRYLQIMSVRVFQLIKVSHGRTLFLFTSNVEMNKCYQFWSPMIRKLGYHCYLQDKKYGKKSIDAKTAFECDVSSCLFSSGYWEGIDIQGPSLSSVIILKLPFPTPSPTFRYRKELLEEKYQTNLKNYEMLKKLRQGVGRLIRGKNDTGLVSILDSRASRPNTKKLILNNIPPFQKIEWQEIPRFFKAFPNMQSA